MDNPILDLPEFQERVQNDDELLLELLDIFVEDYRVKRVQMEAAVEKNDADELRGLAHSLKGASGNISAKMMRDIFHTLEQAGAKNNLEGTKAVFVDMDKQFTALLARIEEIKKELGA